MLTFCLTQELIRYDNKKTLSEIQTITNQSKPSQQGSSGGGESKDTADNPESIELDDVTLFNRLRNTLKINAELIDVQTVSYWERRYNLPHYSRQNDILMRLAPLLPEDQWRTLYIAFLSLHLNEEQYQIAQEPIHSITTHHESQAHTSFAWMMLNGLFDSSHIDNIKIAARISTLDRACVFQLITFKAPLQQVIACQELLYICLQGLAYCPTPQQIINTQYRVSTQISKLNKKDQSQYPFAHCHSHFRGIDPNRYIANHSFLRYESP